MLTQKIKTFNELSTTELYQLLKLRVEVFVVEQECAYPELDNLDLDKATRHILYYRDDNLVAYARCLAPDVVFSKFAAIGRVLVSKQGRGKGLARELMLTAIRVCELSWPKLDIKLSAQTYLLAFYQTLGFKSTGDAYLEDGIEHQDMVKLKRR